MSTLSDDIFALAVAMNRAAYGAPDSPERTAPPDEHGRPFSELPSREQLDLLGRLSDRSAYWREIFQEALGESLQIIAAAFDPDCTDADLGRRLRERLVGYAEQVAARRGDELTEL